jgi:hypothetical protein
LFVCLFVCLFVTAMFVSVLAVPYLRRLVAGFPPQRPGSTPGGVSGGQSVIGPLFLRVYRFHLPIRIPPTAPHSSCIIRGWYSRPVSGRRTKWTQSHPNSTSQNPITGCCPRPHESRPHLNTSVPGVSACRCRCALRTWLQFECKMVIFGESTTRCS